MIVAFSTSSPQASVAIIRDGKVIASERTMAPMAASGACLVIAEGLLARYGLDLRDAEGFAADLGPGSFTGVKVGVTLAKVLAFMHGVKVAGVPSFDLIAGDGPKAVPSRKGEYLIRVDGTPPTLERELPEGAVGYGKDFPEQTFPDAALFGVSLDRCKWMEPERLAPEYVLEPSISQPKKPYLQPGDTPR